MCVSFALTGKKDEKVLANSIVTRFVCPHCDLKILTHRPQGLSRGRQSPLIFETARVGPDYDRIQQASMSADWVTGPTATHAVTTAPNQQPILMLR